MCECVGARIGGSVATAMIVVHGRRRRPQVHAAAAGGSGPVEIDPQFSTLQWLQL